MGNSGWVEMSKKQEQQKLSQWRWYRNKVIGLLKEAGFKPSQIIMLRYCELYKDGKPVRSLQLRPEVGYVGGKKDNVVRLSKRLRDALERLYREPLLFEGGGFCIPVITDRPIARVLTREHVGRITRQTTVR